VARAALPGSRRCRTRERPRRRLQGSPPLARSVDLSGLWWSNGVGLGRPPPGPGGSDAQIAANRPGVQIAWRRPVLAASLPNWGFAGVQRPAGVALALRFPWYIAVELRGFEPLTPCMPCRDRPVKRRWSRRSRCVTPQIGRDRCGPLMTVVVHWHILQASSKFTARTRSASRPPVLAVRASRRFLANTVRNSYQQAMVYYPSARASRPHGPCRCPAWPSTGRGQVGNGVAHLGTVP
jgi:hypothetical protein